ncbi:hypothetical protein PM082_003179 [Marasmius tenuissimus]|nr:hypothetical protein PM082_000956 [Marasmius tenuissimus]KAJ8084410.1 hypothetical protein PM082_003179 [Marasmius tenuissimus]
MGGKMGGEMAVEIAVSFCYLEGSQWQDRRHRRCAFICRKHSPGYKRNESTPKVDEYLEDIMTYGKEREVNKPYLTPTLTTPRSIGASVIGTTVRVCHQAGYFDHTGYLTQPARSPGGWTQFDLPGSPPIPRTPTSPSQHNHNVTINDQEDSTNESAPTRPRPT